MNASELYEKQHERYAKRVYPLFLRALVEQIQPTLEFIRRTGNTQPPLDLLVNPRVFIKPLNEAYQITGELAAKREYYSIRTAETKAISDVLLDAWRAIFYDYSTNYAYRIINELAETTKEEIRRALAYSYDNGYNADRTATYIRNSVGRNIARSRAVLISRTETATAANLGKITGAKSWLKEQGEEGYKEWIGRNDGRERHTHVAMNGVIIPIDEDFNVDGEKASTPGDVRLSAGERCNCRCSVIYMSKRRYDRMMASKTKYNFAIENIL